MLQESGFATLVDLLLKLLLRTRDVIAVLCAAHDYDTTATLTRTSAGATWDVAAGW